MIKRILKFLFLVAFLAVNFIGAGQAVFSQEKNVDAKTEVIFFYSPTCLHCADEEKFLEGLEDKYSQLEIKRYEFSKNIELVLTLYSEYNVPKSEQGLVPLTFINGDYFVGFDEKIGGRIEAQILESSVTDPLSESPQNPKLPIIGEVNVENLSFPAIAAIFGFFDGFNVCSLGALVLILGLVISLKSRKKILFFGGLFVFITAIVYGSMIFLWHRIFVFLSPYLRNMEIIIGLLAAVGGWYLFREYLRSRKSGAVCKYDRISEKLAGRVNDIFEKKSGVLAIVGAVLLFAAVITIIEFPCSAFFPILFSGMLAKSDTPLYLSLLYQGIYIFFYMLDEIIVLVVAAFTMKIWIASPKIMKWLNLAGALILLLFGFYYLLWPTLSVWFNL